MAVIATITVNDGVTPTPNAHPLTPVYGGLETEHRERHATVAAGDLVLKTKFSAANGNRPTDRIDLNFGQPNVVTLSGVDTVRDVARFSIGCVLPTGMSVQERKNFYAYLWNIVNSTSIRNLIESRETMW